MFLLIAVDIVDAVDETDVVVVVVFGFVETVSKFEFEFFETVENSSGEEEELS